MNIDAEIIDITNLDEHPVINLNKSSSKQKSVNFGEGIELLMNEKRKNESNKNMGIDINLDDLNDLENELNNLSAVNDTKPTQVNSKSSLFNQALNSVNDSIKLNVKDDDEVSLTESILSLHDDSKSSIGKSTADKKSFDDAKTWDGFGKFNNIPINPDKEISNSPKISNEEMLLEKFKILRKLEEIERKGVRLTKKYSMDSSLAEMKGEYEMIISEKERSNSCKFQGRMLMAAITGLEFLNNRFDPFDIKLDGWAEQLNENISDYDEIFAELHEKYKSKAKMAPELKLLFQLGGSGIMVHMTNTMFKSAMPGMDDIMRQNPELAQQFTQAAVNSMSQQNPGFGGFMSNFMPGNSGGADINFNNNSRPPAPMFTQQSKSERYAMPSNRPDLSRARGDDGINIQEQFESVGRQPAEKSKPRPEMKGPSDIGDLLAGLKTKTINVQPPPMPTGAVRTPAKQSSHQQVSGLKQNINNNINNVRVDSITELQKTKRKQKSDKNIVSLDI